MPATVLRPGHDAELDRIPTRVLADDSVREETRRLKKQLSRLQERLYAEGRQRLLVVLQAMDTGGKDTVIRKVFRDCNVQGVRVHRFEAPNQRELGRDFLWRAHIVVPPDGHIAVWNRSHYGGVLEERVKGIVPESVWRLRYRQINDFERLLTESGTRILKFFLHISKDEQRRRLQRRLDNPDKRWKFSPDDLTQRAHWDDYQAAYEEALRETTTEWAPWTVVPADDKRSRDHVIAGALVRALEEMDPQYPTVEGLPDTINGQDVLE